MQTTYRKCLHTQRATERLVELDAESTDDGKSLPSTNADDLPESMLVQLEQEQILRDTISELPDRCERMVHLLFFEFPPRPYEDVAKELGMANGSIGAIRSRCLETLRKTLEKKGFR
jgi:RNA polymerase sigma factor (sigma-70 family)